MNNGFQTVLDHIRSIADSEAHKGRLFERLRKHYALTLQFFPFLLALLFLALLPFTAIHGKGTIEKVTPHFRQAFWGDSKEEVLSKETAELVLSNEDGLIFEALIASVPVYVFYNFEDDKLFEARYQGNQGYIETESYMDDFDKFAKLLSAKYGKADNKTFWKDSAAARRYRNGGRRELAMSVNLGYLVYSFAWLTTHTEIVLQLFSKESEITFAVFYYSKELQYLQDKQQKRKDAESLADF